MPIDFSGACPYFEVFDMPTSIHFYRDILGFEIVSQSRPGDHFDFAWLRVKSTEIMLNTAYERENRPPHPDPARIAAHGDTCLYLGCEDLDAAYQHLRAHGVKAREPKIAPYGMKQLYVSDPDNYGLCFQWPVTQVAYDAWVEAYGLKPKTIP